MSPKNPSVVRLLPKRRKGILRLVFSRLLLFLILIALQVVILMMIYRWTIQIRPYYNVFRVTFLGTMVIYLFNSDMDHAAKLTWLAIISLFPIPGAILLWYTQNDLGHRRIMARIYQLIYDTKGSIRQNQAVLMKQELIDSGTDDLCRYVNRTGCFPICKNTDVIYFPSGEDKFEALITELKRARHFIFLEYFILGEGIMWGTVLGILKEKAAQGVDVRVMYDGMCEMSSLSFDYPERIQKLGIRCKDFAPIRPVISTHYNYRDHRKILVIDNQVAFNGGINLSDEYINRTRRFGHWKDTAVMLRGEAVSSFTLMFLQMWNITERNADWTPLLDHPSAPVRAKGYVMPYGDVPMDGDKVGENVYLDILYRARKYVHIMTPYLILDGEMENALKYAAQRGVDVKIILPGIPDKPYAYAIAKTYYNTLTDAGVKIYEYKPGFVHAKVFVSDNCKAVVGSINLDYRSLYHHFECATYLYRTDCIADIERDFKRTLRLCRKVTPLSIQNEKLRYKLLGGLLRIVAPLL